MAAWSLITEGDDIIKAASLPGSCLLEVLFTLSQNLRECELNILMILAVFSVHCTWHNNWSLLADKRDHSRALLWRSDRCRRMLLTQSWSLLYVVNRQYSELLTPTSALERLHMKLGCSIPVFNWSMKNYLSTILCSAIFNKKLLLYDKHSYETRNLTASNPPSIK